MARAAEETKAWARETAERARQTASSAAESTTKAADRAQEALSDAAGAVSDAAGAMSEVAENFAEVSEAAKGKSATKAETRVAHIAYLLAALGPITFGLTSIAALIVGYLRRDEPSVSGTLLQSHYRWLICTFWYGLAALLVSAVLILIWIGWILLAATALWLIWRLVKGWLMLNDGKAIANPTAAL